MVYMFFQQRHSSCQLLKSILIHFIGLEWAISENMDENRLGRDEAMWNKQWMKDTSKMLS